MEEAARRLTDPRAGLVRRVYRDRPRAETVPGCVSYSAEMATRRGLAPGIVDAVTGGAALGDPDRARYAAVGEAVERYYANVVPDGLVRASHRGLADAGVPAVDPREFALYSPSQYGHRGFPFVPMTRDLELEWAVARDLADGEEVLVPASLVYVNYFRGARAGLPPTHYPPLAGTAAGPSRERAVRSALEEVIERDAVTLWWMSGASAGPLRVEPDAVLDAALAGAEAAGLRVTLLRVPSTVDATVAGAFIEDPARRLVAFGSACRGTARHAAAKALCEAIGMHETALELLDHDGSFWGAVRAGRLDHRPYRPHRHDRAYLADHRADYRDVNDVRLHLQLYLDPRAQDERLDRLRLPEGPAQAPGADSGTDGYLASLAAQGLRVLVADLTTRDVRDAGLHVVRVLVPGLTCNAPAAFPFLGGRRLLHEPVARGWVPGPLTEESLVRHPLPFS